MQEEEQQQDTKKFVSRKESLESHFRKEQDEESKKSTKSRRTTPKKSRCPIYMARSEDNLLKGKGIELLELLGEGSYSKVYLCKKTDPTQESKSGAISNVLALKMVDSNKTSVDYTRKFLPRELSVLMKVRHPNIIRMYMLFQRKSKFYILMRFAERGDLLEYILNNGLITENRARFWTYQIATALEYLHTMNVVHRDIKTENILITECFNVKLSDFGFSRFIGHEELSLTFCGSISYSPPEILDLKPHDAKKCDMWSLGVVVFVMLIKRLPFRESENPKLLLAEQLEKSYIMPPKMEEILSLPSKKALKHLLQTNPAKRWDIKELLGSQWMAMDFRLTKRSEAELEALEQAMRIAEEIEHGASLDVTSVTSMSRDSQREQQPSTGKSVRFSKEKPAAGEGRPGSSAKRSLKKSTRQKSVTAGRKSRQKMEAALRSRASSPIRNTNVLQIIEPKKWLSMSRINA